MADRIITVTDPSVVTNDTLASYNNYTDQPSANTLIGSMTPTEATNGKTVTLSDGVVHSVTTKPVGTTNGEFSAVVSNAVTVDLSGGGALFEDDFTGASINLTKWTITTTDVDFTQNDELLMTTDPGNGSQNNDDGKMVSDTLFDMSSSFQVEFKMQMPLADTTLQIGILNIGFRDPTNYDSRIAFQRLGTTTNRNFSCQSLIDNVIGTNETVTPPTGIDAGLINMRISYDAGDIVWSYFNGSIWVDLHSYTEVHTGDYAFHVSHSTGISTSYEVTQVKVDDVIVTSL